MNRYEGLKGRLERLIVSDAQVDQQIDQLLGQMVRRVPVTDRPARLDDEVLLDYAGFVGDVQFEGGTAQDQRLVLGSGTFIPSFEDQLVGARPGDEVEVRVTFPANYRAAELAGREAVFHCKVKGVSLCEKYAPDDEFARAVGPYLTFEALREGMRQGLQAYLDERAEDDLKLRLLDQLVSRCAFEFTEAQMSGAIDREMKTLENNLNKQGLTLEAFCQFTGKTVDQLRQECRPDARRSLMRRRVIAQIVQDEGLEATEAEVARSIQRVCRDNGISLEELTARMDESAQHALVSDILTHKALTLLRNRAEVEVTEKRP